MERLKSGNDVSNDRLLLAKLGAAPAEQGAYAAALARLGSHAPFVEGEQIAGAEAVEVTRELYRPWEVNVKRDSTAAAVR